MSVDDALKRVRAAGAARAAAHDAELAAAEAAEEEAEWRRERAVLRAAQLELFWRSDDSMISTSEVSCCIGCACALGTANGEEPAGREEAICLSLSLSASRALFCTGAPQALSLLFRHKRA